MAERKGFSNDGGEVPADVPPALHIDDADRGTCSACGDSTYRPEGTTPSGRRLRIPKYCETCKTAKTPTKGTATRTRRRPAVDVEAGMTEFYTTLGLLVAMKDPQAGTMIVGERRMQQLVEGAADRDYSMADDAGKAWANVAASHPAWDKALRQFLATGVWAELANAHAPAVALVIRRRPRFLLRVRQWFARRWGRGNGNVS